MTFARFMTLAFLTLLASHAHAEAGTSVGNGGDAVICSNGDHETVALLDTFEARRLGELHFAPRAVGGFQEKVEAVLEKLGRWSPRRAANYRSNFAALLTSLEYSPVPLKPLDDEGSLAVMLPSGCRIEQLAFQVPRALGQSGKRLVINGFLFDLLAVDDQAALFLHELVTEELSSLGVRTSERLRPFIAFLLSDEFSEVESESFVDLLKHTGFFTFESRGLTFMLYDVDGVERHYEFFNKSSLRSAVLAEPQNVFVADSRLLAVGEVVMRADGLIEQFTLGRSISPHEWGCLPKRVLAGSRIFVSYGPKGRVNCSVAVPVSDEVVFE